VMVFIMTTAVALLIFYLLREKHDSKEVKA
jgi:hypothetical protein